MFWRGDWSWSWSLLLAHAYRGHGAVDAYRPAIDIPSNAGGVQDSLALYIDASSSAPSGKAGGDKGPRSKCLTTTSNRRQATSGLDPSTDPSPPTTEDNKQALAPQQRNNAPQQRTQTTYIAMGPNRQPTPHIHIYIYAHTNSYIHENCKYVFGAGQPL